MNGQSNFSCKSPKLESVQLLISRWKYKKIITYMLLNNYKEQTIDKRNMGASQIHGEWKERSKME